MRSAPASTTSPSCPPFSAIGGAIRQPAAALRTSWRAQILSNCSAVWPLLRAPASAIGVRRRGRIEIKCRASGWDGAVLLTFREEFSRNRGGKSGGQFLPQRTQSGGLFSHKRTEPVFLLRGRRLSDARTKCCLSTHPWILALRLRDGARARALAESRRIPEAMRGVESVMACGLILLLQSSARSCERRATSLPWLLSC